MIIVNGDGTATVMLATESAVCTALNCGLARHCDGTIELEPRFTLGLAQGYADALGGRVLRTWHDHNAGATLAQIELWLDADDGGRHA